MVHEIELLLRRGFNVVSIMVDPFGVVKEPFDQPDIFLSLTHKDFSSILRFLARCQGFPKLCEIMSLLIKMYDERAGDIWRLPNSRLALNSLETEKIYMQGTSHGIKFAKETLGFTVNERKQN